MRKEAVTHMEKEHYYNPELEDNIREDVENQLETDNLDEDLKFILSSLKPKLDKELPRTVEIRERLYIPQFAVLGISGKGSVGNTTTADFAGKEYGIPPHRIFHAGEIFKDYRDRMDPNHPDHDSIAFIKRPEDLDRFVDEMILEQIMEATPDNPTILEGKLVGALLRYLEQNADRLGYKLPAPRAAFLKWADNKKRIEISGKKKGQEGYKVDEIRKMLNEKHEDDMKTWIRVHRWLVNYKNILEKNARDNEGEPLYQDIIDASDHSGPEDDFKDLNSKLVRLGFVVEYKEQVMQRGRSVFMGYHPEENLPYIFGDEDPGN